MGWSRSGQHHQFVRRIANNEQPRVSSYLRHIVQASASAVESIAIVSFSIFCKLSRKIPNGVKATSETSALTAGCFSASRSACAINFTISDKNPDRSSIESDGQLKLGTSFHAFAI